MSQPISIHDPMLLFGPIKAWMVRRKVMELGMNVPPKIKKERRTWTDAPSKDGWYLFKRNKCKQELIEVNDSLVFTVSKHSKGMPIDRFHGKWCHLID